MSSQFPSPSGDGDPLADLLRQLMGQLGGAPGGSPGLPPVPGLPSDPAALQQMFGQLQNLLAGAGDGAINWDLAQQLAREAAGSGGDPTVGEAAQRQVADALRTADLWLDRACDLPSAAARSFAWSRAEWVEATLPTWRGIVEPLAERVADAMAEAVTAQAPEEFRPMLAGALPMMRRMGGAFFGSQVGQAVGTLAREVAGGFDVGLPLLAPGQVALLPANVTAFGEGLGVPEDEVRLFLALREAAHARLFAGRPWLRGHLLNAVADYARGIRIDTERIEASVRELDLSDMEALQSALASGVFQPENTPEQEHALRRLETSLALLEGWVDEVAYGAAQQTLPHASALRETVRRRRATGGPAEHTFAALVGLTLRPRRLREAAAVWAALDAERGHAGRDALWQHPDLLPTEDAFTDPRGFARGGGAGGGGDEVDDALRRLLEDAEGHPGEGGRDTP